MKGNILAIFMNILSVVLVVGIVLLYMQSDRTEPEFRFSALDLVYDAETTDEELLQGVNAYDSVDGDLTSRIAVEKVVVNYDDKIAVVYYAVSDLSGNVAKQSRVFEADVESIQALDSEGLQENGNYADIIQYDSESDMSTEGVSGFSEDASNSASSEDSSQE